MIADQLSLMRALMPQAGPQPSAMNSPDLLGGIQQAPSWVQSLGAPMPGMAPPGHLPQAMPGMPQAPMAGALPGGPPAPMAAAGPTVTVPVPKPPQEDPLMTAIKQLVMGR